MMLHSNTHIYQRSFASARNCIPPYSSLYRGASEEMDPWGVHNLRSEGVDLIAHIEMSQILKCR